jgi:hypothetical protein
MKTTDTTNVTTQPRTVADLPPQGATGVKGGLSLNYTKVEFKYIAYDDKH